MSRSDNAAALASLLDNLSAALRHREELAERLAILQKDHQEQEERVVVLSSQVVEALAVKPADPIAAEAPPEQSASEEVPTLLALKRGEPNLRPSYWRVLERLRNSPYQLSVRDLPIGNERSAALLGTLARLGLARKNASGKWEAVR